jgi:hypothetical protein
MAVEYTNKRGRVGSLPQAPAVTPAPVVQVATPKVAQPAEPVRAIRPEQSSLGQIANSLSFFNENLRSFGEVYTRISNKENFEQGQQMALEDLQKARQITKLGFKKASEQGLIDPGANPYMRLGLYETTGKLAGQDYREALLKRRDEVNSPYSKINEDQLIAEERQKFMDQMGDNFYSQQGFLGEANTAEQSFRNAVISEKAKFTEVETREKDSLAITKNIKQLVEQVTPEDKANALNSLKDLYNKRSEYAPNVNALMSQDIGNAIKALSKENPEKAQETLDSISTMVITRRDGSTASFGEVIAPVVDEVQNSIDTAIYKQEANWERRQKQEDNRAEVAIDTEIKKLVASKTNLLDAGVSEALIKSVMDKNPNASLGSVSQQVFTQLAQVSAPAQADAIEDVFNIAQTSPEEAIQAVKDRIGISISWQEGQKLIASFTRTNDNLKLLDGPATRYAYSNFESDIKAQDFYTQNLLPAEQGAFLNNAKSLFDSKVTSFLNSLDPNMPNTEVDTLLRKELPSISKETTNELLKTSNEKALKTQAYLSPRLKNEIKTGAQDPKVSPVAEWKLSSLVFPNTNPNPNEILLSRWGRLEQLQNQLDVTAQGTKLPEFRPERALKEQSELKQFMADKSQTYLTQLSKLINAGGVEVADMFSDTPATYEFYPFTPEQTEKYNSDYLKIKSRIGFSSTELASGVTSDGIKFDPKTLSTDGTLFFKSSAEARKAIDDYKNAVKTDANGFTTFEGSAQGYYVQTLIDLYGLKDEATLTNFFANQKLKLELLGR